MERRDWLWNLLEEAALTLVWFNVPLWWVVRSIRLSREQVVDAEAVQRSKARRPYLKALLEMAGQKSLAESLPAALFLRESELAERVALMMKEVHMSRTQMTVSILTAAGVLLIAGASAVWAFPLKISARQTAAPEASSAAVSAENGIAAELYPLGNSAAEAVSGQKNMKIYKVGGKVTAPEPTYKPEPPYTHQAQKSRLSGNVVLRAVIDAKGRVVSVKQVSKPLGQGLDESAINTVQSWKFKPAMRDGVPVAVRVMVEITFKLDGKPGAASPKPDPQPNPANDPPPQAKQAAPEPAKDNGQAIKINQAEIQRQVEQAMKQAKVAQQAAAKVKSAEIQRQIKQALQQAKIAQQAAEEINKAEIQRQIAQAMEQATIAQQVTEKVNKAEIQQQIEQATKQAKAALQQAQKAQEKAKKQLNELKPPSPPPAPPPPQGP